MTKPTASLAHISNGDLLAELERRYLPNPLAPFPLEMFNFLNRCRPATTIEIVVLRATSAGPEVLVTDREPGDTAYAGNCHVPGGYLYFLEPALAAVERIARRELGAGLTSAVYAGALFDRHEARGHHIHQVFVVALSTPPRRGRWAPISHLPSSLIPQHRPVIEMAAAVYTGARPAAQCIEYEPTT